MPRNYYFAFLFTAIGIFIIDQGIKEWAILEAMAQYGATKDELYGSAVDIWQSSCINMRLVFNEGVAFSMFSFLQEKLKWIQLLLITGVVGFLLAQKKSCYMVPTGIIAGAGLSNVYDRFNHGGVVDYVFWHCGFDFAIFNFADVMIDVAVALFILFQLKPQWCKNIFHKEDI